MTSQNTPDSAHCSPAHDAAETVWAASEYSPTALKLEPGSLLLAERLAQLT